MPAHKYSKIIVLSLQNGNYPKGKVQLKKKKKKGNMP